MMDFLVRISRTVDGRDVLAGVYRTFETTGIPLDVLLGVLHEKNAIPCWISFHREARAAGMAHERILSKLDEAICDSYGPETRDVVLRTLRHLHDTGNPILTTGDIWERSSV